MLGAIYTGLSGMNAFSQGLQTISDNVTNLNTVGYKANTTSFSDLYSFGGGGLSFSSGAGDTAGSGVRFNKPAVDFSEGQLQQTGGDLDLAIQGSGFLVLQKDGGAYYARTGKFAVGEDGYIALEGGHYKLAVLDANHQPTAVNVDAKRTSAPTATTKVVFADNLSSGATTATVSSIKVYDANGAQHVWQVSLAPVGTTAPGSWTATVTDETGATVGSGTIGFLGGAPDPAHAQITIATTPTNAPALSVILDFSQGVTSYSSGTTSTLRVGSSDGKAAGTLTTVTVDDTGQIKLTYTNGATDVAGAVALADFRDPQELARIGSGLFTDKGHGPMQLVASGQNGVGTLVSKQLEGSNVNLSQEFGNLILIQRGFQASSQVVSVANDMLQQLFGIRGQG
jgi:flagellar hook protein FlgE